MQIPPPLLTLLRTSLLIRAGLYQRNNLLHGLIIHVIKPFLLPVFCYNTGTNNKQYVLAAELAHSYVRLRVAFCIRQTAFPPFTLIYQLLKPK
jgi:hypothetical protein